MWERIWPRIKEFVGDLWGKATMLSVTIGAAIMAVPLPPDTVIPSWLRWCLFSLAIGVAVLRQVAPPPPAQTIRKEDAVVVDHEAGTVTITKAAPLPEAMVSKPAGVDPHEPPKPQD